MKLVLFYCTEVRPRSERTRMVLRALVRSNARDRAMARDACLGTLELAVGFKRAPGTNRRDGFVFVSNHRWNRWRERLRR